MASSKVVLLVVFGLTEGIEVKHIMSVDIVDDLVLEEIVNYLCDAADNLEIRINNQQQQNWCRRELTSHAQPMWVNASLLPPRSDGVSATAR